MNRKTDRIAMIAGIVGIIAGTIGGVMLMIASFLDEDIPKALWAAVVICDFVNAVLLLRFANRKNGERK